MRIDSSAIAFQAAHVAVESFEVEERLEIRPPTPSTISSSQPEVPRDSISYMDFKTALAMWLHEFFTGRKAQIIGVAGFGARAGPGVPGGRSGAPAPSISYSRQEVHREAEASVFSAEGTVKLDSGKTISFSLKLEMNREQTEARSFSIRSGNMSDPIAVNLDGLGVKLSQDRTAFDLNGDGQDEWIATLAAGSAWLAQDRNGNRQVDDGGELFGPQSGNGFSELAALDSDRNGWIDEGDASYASMGIWRDGQFTSLKDAGIGALATGSVATPFTLKSGGETLGQVRGSGVYLTEDGKAGALQQVDLSL